MSAVDKSNYNNSWYKPGPLWKRLLWHYTSALLFQSGLLPTSGLKAKILRAFGAKVGVGLTIKPYVTIKYPWFLELGDYVGLGEQCWIDNLAVVRIDDQATISQGALLLTGNHDFSSPGFELLLGEINIGKGAWIGAKTVVAPGVTIGDHAILTACSLATKDMIKNGIYAGQPAEWVKERIIKPK